MEKKEMLVNARGELNNIKSFLLLQNIAQCR